MQVSKIPEFFTDTLLFTSISEYLTKKDVLNLTYISKQMKQIVEQYCKKLLLQLKMKPSSHKSSTHQMQFYFNRCLRMVREDKNWEIKQGSKEDILDNVATLYYPFKFQSIKQFQVGTTYVCYLTRDEKAKIFRTSHLLKFYQQQKQHKKQINKQLTPKYIIRNGVKDIRCKSDQAIMTKVNGQVSLLSTNRNQQQILMSQETIAWTSRLPVQAVYNSFNYTIFILQAFVKLQTIMSQVFGKQLIKRQQIYEQKQCINYVGRNMLTNKQFIIQVPCGQVIDGTVGNRFAYFISNKNQVYEVDLQENVNTQIPLFKAKLFQPLKGCSIVKIKNGYNYYIALQRNIQQLQEWDTERVVQWLRQIGFEEYIKIARYEKLDGKKLKNIEKKYMHNVLGITTQNMQQKFLMSIQQYLQKKSRNEKLWGWGKNQSGQLGSSSANFVSKPRKIRFNSLLEGEHIDTIFCGWFTTFVRTQKGRVFCTMTKKEEHKRKGSQRQVEKQQQTHTSEQQKIIIKKHVHSKQQSEEQEQLQISKKRSNKNKGGKQNKQSRNRKKTVQTHPHTHLKQKNNKKFEQQNSWYELPLGKAFNVQTYKDILFVIQCPIQNKQQTHKNKKLRTAKAILDKILWSNLNKDQFKVGYMDKDMGLIQASAKDMQKFDVKQNRVKYFKRNGTIIWDRDNKIDFF